MVSLLKSVAQLDAFILSANHSGAGGEGGDVGLSAEPPDLLVGHWTLDTGNGHWTSRMQDPDRCKCVPACFYALSRETLD